MKKILFLILLGFSSFIYAQEFTDLKGDYLGQIPPGNTPVVFARGIISSDDQEHSPAVFSPDGNEVYWFTCRPPGQGNSDWLNRVMTMRRIENRWTVPVVSPFNGPIAISPDGNRGYFWSHSDKEVFVVEKQGDHWSKPKCLNIIKQYPELEIAVDPSSTQKGTLYFLGIAKELGTSNNYGIYRAELINGEYAKPQLLPRCINLPPFLNWTPFIAPEESYLIFSSSRGTPKDDGGDLYISFRHQDGSWTNPVNLGKPISTDQQERYPRVSWDGKYLFFSRWTKDHDEDVFWVSAGIIGKLKTKVIKELRRKQ